MTDFDERCDSHVLKDLDDIFTALDESLANINMILGSRFVKPLRAEAEQWKKWIMTISDMVDEWVMCQKNWRYLQNIFKADDIQKALPQENSMFTKVTTFFTSLMTKTQKQPNCLKIVKGQQNVLEALK